MNTGRNLDDLDRDILAAVKACGENAYGAPLHRYLVDHGHAWTSLVGMYVRLDRMEQMGVVRSWEEPGGPERGYRNRRYWALTRRGAA